jgi:uncharacterized membrane protein
MRTGLTGNDPSKRGSAALIAAVLTIPAEIVFILLNIGGLVSIVAAFLVLFLIVHQVRLRLAGDAATDRASSV